MKLGYELIALDVDGTLLTDDHRLLEEVKDAVREAEQAGATIVLCTGRGPMGTFPVLSELELSGILITHNGAATIRSENHEVLFQYDMDSRELTEFLDYCREHRIHFDLNTVFDMYVESVSEEVQKMYEHHQVEPIMDTFDVRLPDGLVKVTLFGSKELMDQTQTYWEHKASSLQFIRSGDFFIDVQSPSSSKGIALKQLAEVKGIARENILAIGNYYNDISMLQYAGLGIAMSNSPESVKRAADRIAGSNNEGGVAAAIREYVWKQS
ncbi:Cof-type HAD-IIB family hydrolase [Paenibacillus paeoniae]|uniref:HAD family phosphatase n=1 Tax=Paenibacillus paeoniae TaxID=2292705 RepID=A0A371PMN1_9BACL|nr:Cof-type HAD-IIB family hydrolase [Paenibacillus paeoniae]REK77452.1 HAD family phosphatase [Paenibacillus paeoniae]